jgi:phage/plasmid-associated DNA primase
MPPPNVTLHYAATVDKVKLFQDLGCVLGNVILQFTDNGNKTSKFVSKWKNLTQSERITGSNFLIRTGEGFGITVFDIDVKKGKNAILGLLDVDIDFDEYLDDCIKVKTQSGGLHYIFRYDSRFKTGANCFGIDGFDIRNEGACIFAGNRYDIVSVGEHFGAKSSLHDLFDRLSCWRSKTAVKEPGVRLKSSRVKEPVVYEAAIHQKYYELLNLLPDNWFNSFDLWIKPIYALKNAPDVSDELALNTSLRLLRERSKAPNEDETRRVFNLESKTSARFSIASIVNILKKDETLCLLYKQWQNKWREQEEMSQLESLKNKLFEVVRKQDYRREYLTGRIFEKKLPYHYEKTFDTAQEFLNAIFMNETCYQSCTKQRHQELIYFILNIAHPQFAFITVDMNLVGFRNGVYCLTDASFVGLNELPSDVKLVRKYIDINFDIKGEAPLLDEYLSYQFKDPKDREFIYFLVGRAMTRLEDKFDFITFIYGLANTGKSLLLNLLKHSHSAGDMAILSGNREQNFGLQAVYDKHLFCCDDVRNIAKTLPKDEFLSMASRGSISVPVKNRQAVQVHDWNIPTIINSNYLPNYEDASGEVIRRLMVINFQEVVESSRVDTQLEYRIKDREYGIFLHRCRSTYLKIYAQFHNQSVESFAPPLFIEQREMLREECNPSCLFVKQHFEYRENERVPLRVINRGFKSYLQLRFKNNDCRKFVSISEFTRVSSLFKLERLNICKSCGQYHAKNCCGAYQRLARTKREYITNIAIKSQSKLDLDFGDEEPV